MLLTVGKENGQRCSQESRLLQRAHKCHRVERTLRRRDSRPQGQVGENQQSENKERADAHGPAESDFGNQVYHHDWKDDASKQGSDSNEAESCTSFLKEPGRSL